MPENNGGAQMPSTINKSPAVARVSRPYSWCTLATCSNMLLPEPEM